MSGSERVPDTNPTFGLEQHGFDYIPERERGMTLRDLAYVWVGANAYLFFFSVGVIAFSLGLFAFQGQHATDWAPLMMASTLTTLPLVVLFFFTQRYFLQGITLTGLKG